MRTGSLASMLLFLWLSAADAITARQGIYDWLHPWATALGPATSAPCPERLMAAPGVSFWRVTSFDTSGQWSEPSAEMTLTIPPLRPTR